MQDIFDSKDPAVAGAPLCSVEDPASAYFAGVGLIHRNEVFLLCMSLNASLTGQSRDP